LEIVSFEKEKKEYCMCVCVCVTHFLLFFVKKSGQRVIWPMPYHHVQEIQKYNLPDYRPRMDRFRQAVNKVRRIQRLKRSRGYAFSQNESDQTKIIRAYDTTVQKPQG
jgi:phospholipid-transporting ATPase